jgi:threonine/homoserine/homoserine lactone efflux protein
MSPEFLITTFLVVASPGTGAIYTLAVGLSQGGRKSLAAAFGCTLGILPHLAAASLGLTALLHASALLFDLFKYAGAAYLIFLAWQVWRDKGSLSLTAEVGERSSLGLVVKAVLINLLNPKLSIFFVAFLPQFIAPQSTTPMADMLMLSAVFMAMTFVVFAVYGVLASSIRHRIAARPGLMIGFNRVFALAFFALGAKLAMARV